MNVLYVTGSCLTKNTSANMSHNSYVQGLLENGHHVDIVMAKEGWGQQDAGLPVWPQATYHAYDSVAVQDRLRLKLRGSFGSAPAADVRQDVSPSQPKAKPSMKNRVRASIKKLFYLCFPADPLYPLEHTWLKKAAKFHNAVPYDLVISNSSPAASHRLAATLLEKGTLKCSRWIQIWEDPWYFDLYAGRDEAIREEEHALLRTADEVYYVSPLTLEYQKRFFPDCAHKMKHIPLPYLEVAEDDPAAWVSGSFGYFGDYYSQTRNLLPFYEALKASGFSGSIYGDSDLNLASTDSITVSGRVTLDVLARVQERTEVLVHLCNLRGGQIPGKIYHYSATKKPILFILDGTREEQEILRTYFSQFDRYYFCENNKESILRTIQTLRADIAGGKTWSTVEEFSPRAVVSRLWKE